MLVMEMDFYSLSFLPDELRLYHFQNKDVHSKIVIYTLYNFKIIKNTSNYKEGKRTKQLFNV